MPINAGSQPLYKRNAYGLSIQSVVHSTYTAENIIFMHAYLVSLPDTPTPIKQRGSMAYVSEVVEAFERACPGVDIGQAMYLIAIPYDTKKWALTSFGIDL